MISTETIQLCIDKPLDNWLSRSSIMELMREVVASRKSSKAEHVAYIFDHPENLALSNFRDAMEGIVHIKRTLTESFGGLHGTHVEPDVIKECKAICDAIHAAYVRTGDDHLTDTANHQFESLHANRLSD